MKIAALIATRKGSKRIKNKSLQSFGRYNLTTLKIQQCIKSGIFSNIYFSSDIAILNSYAKKRNLILVRRPKKYLGISTISKFAPYLSKKIEENHICYLTNTSPLLKISTIKKCVRIYKSLDFKKYDSLSTFENCYDFLWKNNKPINYKVQKQPISQKLRGIFKFIPALSINNKKNIIKYKNVIGVKPYKFILSRPETIDIDTIFDLNLAKLHRYKKIL